MRSDSADGPPLTRTQQARRDDIIAAAIVVINRDGYLAASIDKIAKQAGTSKSTVLYHFKTKEAINEALVGSLFADGAAFMGPHIVAARTYRDKLRAYLTSNLQYIADNAEHIAAVHRIQHNVGPTGDGADAVDWLAQMLRKGQRAREFGRFDALVMAQAIRAIIDSASFHFTEHRDLDVALYIREAVQLFDKATGPERKD